MANEEKTDRQKLKEALDAGDKRSKENGEELTRRYREAGVSMFGSHPDYPGEMVEVLPDGRWFIIKKENGQNVRVREVEPWNPGE
jgi:hypothetical protein